MHTLCRVLSIPLVMVFVLTLTGCGTGVSPADAPTQATATYVVRAGDTLGGIAQAYHTTPDVLIDLNADQYPQLRERQGRLVVVGWELKVPAVLGQANGSGTLGQRSIDGDDTSTVIVSTDAPTSLPASDWQTIAGGDIAGGSVNMALVTIDMDAANETIRLTNDERSALGVAAVVQDPGLMDLACSRGRALLMNYSHEGATTAEIIQMAYKPDTGSTTLVANWRASPPHYALMSDGSYNRIGACVVRAPEVTFQGATAGFTYAIQVFGR